MSETATVDVAVKLERRVEQYVAIRDKIKRMQEQHTQELAKNI